MSDSLTRYHARGPFTGHLGLCSRRDMLRNASNGFGLTALSSLLADRAYAGLSDGAVQHHPAAAKSVIFCFMAGGVSHVDSFDPKSALEKYDGRSVGDLSHEKKSQNNGSRTWLKSPWKFRPHGESGIPVSELFPHTGGCIDDIAVVRSMVAELPLHAAGNLFMHTGRLRAGSPSIGSWIAYGLGSENRNLPGYVLLENGKVPPGGRENYANGYLPADFQATPIRAQGVPVENIVPAGASRDVQRAKLDFLGRQDRDFSTALGRSDDSIESAIRNYEMAYLMQSSVPDLLDLSEETLSTRQMYGVESDDEQLRLYGTQCLRARRLVEQGVRFVEITANPLEMSVGSWDQHEDLKANHERNALVVDQPIAAMITDLKCRGLLQDTLILFAGEMGRTPHTENGDGRDHHVGGFSVWLAGGGIKGGTVHGVTDELGMHSVEGIVSVFDLHATILHLLGLDHERLTYRYGGRDMSLTDVHGRVIHEIIA
ncbi:MAG: DUF1501 domain-containing protein [Fuerstiella sp.]|nr:DUF1501 domain-containing protein [Fuerstiella sp.]